MSGVTVLTGDLAVDTSMQQCSFCGTPIDHAAEAAVADTSRISQA